MVKRRKMLIGIGSLAAGAAGAVGTGAFSSAADRSLDIDVVGDASAYAGIDPNTASQFVSTSSPMSIDLASDSGNGGSGLPEFADTMIAPAFSLTNQGSDTLYYEIYNPLSNNDITTSSSRVPNYGAAGGGRERDLGTEGLDVQFFATDSFPIDGSSALIDRGTSPVNSLGGEFDDIGSNNRLFGSSEAVSNNRIALTGGSGTNGYNTGAIVLAPGEDVKVAMRVVTREVSQSIPELNVRVEAYSDKGPLSYPVVNEGISGVGI